MRCRQPFCLADSHVDHGDKAQCPLPSCCMCQAAASRRPVLKWYPCLPAHGKLLSSVCAISQRNPLTAHLFALDVAGGPCSSAALASINCLHNSGKLSDDAVQRLSNCKDGRHLENDLGFAGQGGSGIAGWGPGDTARQQPAQRLLQHWPSFWQVSFPAAGDVFVCAASSPSASVSLNEASSAWDCKTCLHRQLQRMFAHGRSR